MGAEWRYQLRVYLPDDLADLARTDREAPVLGPLAEVLIKHDATLVSQLDAFQDYVAEAEREGPEKYLLYRGTKATIEDSAKRLKHKKAFALRVSGEEVYAKETADALEAALKPLVGGGLVERMSRHDTNPANNLAVPAEYRS
jgi:hypothetical protein